MEKSKSSDEDNFPFKNILAELLRAKLNDIINLWQNINRNFQVLGEKNGN